MDLWNVKDLSPPPVSSCIVTTKEVDIRLLDIALQEGYRFFDDERHLGTESALLSRAVYRFKMKFRSSKDFKSVEILNRVLRIYLDMRIPQMLKTLLDSIPKNYKINRTYVLTRNMMDYVLVRMQGLGKILCRLLDACKTVSTWMQKRLRLGHFWKVALVILATASRIFVVTKKVLKYACELYSKLQPFSQCLNNAGVKWLPDGYELPGRLDEWLGMDLVELENEVIEIPDDVEEPCMAYLKLTDSDDEVEFCDEYILVQDESVIMVDDDVDESVVEVESVQLSQSDVDVGVEIEDSSCKNGVIRIDTAPTPQKKKKKSRKNSGVKESPTKKRKRTTSDASSGIIVKKSPLRSPKKRKRKPRQSPKIPK